VEKFRVKKRFQACAMLAKEKAKKTFSDIGGSVYSSGRLSIFVKK
jgi:hypothetical protein